MTTCYIIAALLLAHYLSHHTLKISIPKDKETDPTPYTCYRCGYRYEDTVCGPQYHYQGHKHIPLCPTCYTETDEDECVVPLTPEDLGLMGMEVL